MTDSEAGKLVRGKYLVGGVTTREGASPETELIENGALYCENGVVVATGTEAELIARYQPRTIVGSGNDVILPGFVNSHHHVGLTPLQLGSLDQPLELWFATRLSARAVDIYLDTLYSAFEMIESGVTTVQHLHGMRRGAPLSLLDAALQVIRAYQDIGMRVSYSYGIRDQNLLVYEPDDEFLARLPEDLANRLGAHFKTQVVPLDEQFELFEELHQRFRHDARVRIQLAPANLHWCSDGALERLGECAATHGVPMHMHLVETPYQKAYARRRGGGTAFGYIEALGLTGPKMTLGHGVWLNLEDIEKVASTGTRICHNCSSNLRLRSGIAPLNVFAEHGVPVAIGMDEAGINDDRDMLQEMRLVLKLHREPGMDHRAPYAAQVLQMATEHGANTTPFGDSLGRLEPGRAADAVLIAWDQIAKPFLDPDIPVVDAVLHRAKTTGVKVVMVAGEIIYQDGRFTRVDRDAVLSEIEAKFAQPRSDAERARRALAKDVLPYVKTFYDGYLDDESRAPFYKRNSHV